MPLGNKPFENNVGKGEIAPNEQFLLFPVFSTCLDNCLPFSSNLKLSSANSFSLEESKICRLVMGQLNFMSICMVGVFIQSQVIFRKSMPISEMGPRVPAKML